ncbi:MAG: hypothetical protein II155_02220 [Clostridia bacterium]|nr:hypothetical protein [Clostridia bacterium]
MSNDLISRSHFDDRVRLAAGPDADEEFSADFLDGVKTVLYMLSTEPAVPQEMTVSEFARVRNRMCLFHFPFCNGCTVLPERKECGEVIHDCPLWTLRDTDKAVAVVKEWAREHPERSEE